MDNKCNENSFLKSRLFVGLISFLLGSIIMFLIIYLSTNTPILIQRVTSENIKTTTLEEESDLKEGIKNVFDSVVYIEASSNNSISAGSGVVYKKDENYGYIITNYHLIKSRGIYTVTFSNNKETSATLLGGDEYYDIAILRVSDDSINTTAQLGNSSSIEIGDSVFTVGAPFGRNYMGTITKGIISGTNRLVPIKTENSTYLMNVIQTDASINTGNSGGPLCNIKGEVIGITSSKLMGSGVEGMSFAIPINTVKELLETIELGNKVERPYLGVNLVDITDSPLLKYYYNIDVEIDVNNGVIISVIEKDSSVEKSGLQVGDVIVDIDGVKVKDIAHFKYLLYQHKIGDKIKVKYYRNNKLHEATIELTNKKSE